MNEVGSKLGWKSTNFDPLVIKNDPPVVKFLQKTGCFSTLHTDAQHWLTEPIRAAQWHLSQILSVVRHSHNMVRSAKERFAMERMATRGFGVVSQSMCVGTTCGFSALCSCCRWDTSLSTQYLYLNPTFTGHLAKLIGSLGYVETKRIRLLICLLFVLESSQNPSDFCHEEVTLFVRLDGEHPPLGVIISRFNLPQINEIETSVSTQDLHSRCFASANCFVISSYFLSGCFHSCTRIHFGSGSCCSSTGSHTTFQHVSGSTINSLWNINLHVAEVVGPCIEVQKTVVHTAWWSSCKCPLELHFR